MRVIGLTDTGKARNTNEDYCLFGNFSADSAWCVVCDGMGGANGGEVASKMAAEAISSFIISGFKEELSAPNIKNLLINAVNVANEKVHEYSLGNFECRGMGTTVVAAIAAGGSIHCVHVGDSRMYIKSEGEFTQVTIDHSFVQDLINFGEITPEQAKVHPQRNIITRVLGVYSQIKCDYDLVDFDEGDMAIICTDGLSGYAADALLNEFMDKYEGKDLVERLIEFANNCGGADNITAVTIENRKV